jgi:glycosyltransferase involved in cell wall biosynthesis
MRILLFNLVTDADDPILGFTTRWIRALAESAEHVDVLTMSAGRRALPDNVRVYSVGKEKGYSEPRRVAEFYRHLLQVLQQGRIDVCFSHMMPLFTVLAAPVLKAYRIPIVTWYAHLSLPVLLKLAHHASDRMVTSIATAYPYTHDKLTVIGQGIDTDVFSPNGDAPAEDLPVILCAGRLSPVKDHLTLLQAARLLRQRHSRAFRVLILGSPAGLAGERYLQSLHTQAAELGVSDLVSFAPAVPMHSLASWYRRCLVHVNLTPTGSGDKVAWEAMSCGKPCVVANEGFRETLGEYGPSLLFRYGDAEDLTDKLAALLALPASAQERMGDYLRQQVLQLHSINSLARNLTAVLQSVLTVPTSLPLLRERERDVRRTG